MRKTSDKVRRDDNTPRLDGGWAWVVMVASFLSNALTGGVYFGYGVLLPEWINEFQSSSAMASFVGSATAGMISGSGPIASFVVTKWGCRTSQMLGGVIISLAFVLCHFASSMLHIFILYSLMAGIGGGLCIIPSVVVISEYFKKKRSIAVGIVCSGNGFGSFAFPLLYKYLIKEYGWRGAMLISGAISLNMVAFGLVMCPVETAPEMNWSTFQQCQLCHKSENLTVDSEEDVLEMDFNRNVLPKIQTASGLPRKRRINSFQLVRTWLRFPFVSRKSSRAKYEVRKVSVESNKDVFQTDDTEKQETENAVTSGSLSIQSQSEQKQETYFRQLKTLLKKPSVYVLLCHNLTMFIGMMIVFGLTPLRAVKDHSMTTTQGALLVSILGLSNLFGRFVWGFVASLKTVNTTLLFVSLRLIAAILTLASPFANTFELSAAYCSMAGLALGNWSIYPLIVAKLFGDRLLTVTFGYLEVANGIGCMIGPLFGGFLYDVTMTYQYSFIAGGISLLVGVVPLIVTGL